MTAAISAVHPVPILAELAARARSPQTGLFPGNEDPVGYWLTPPEIMDPLQEEFRFEFDACPYPRPAGFDALKEEWCSPAYCNPPFRVADMGAGPTAWARKAIAESKKGKTVVYLYPMDKWVLEMVQAGAELRPCPPILWIDPRGRRGKAGGRGHMLFILRGEQP